MWWRDIINNDNNISNNEYIDNNVRNMNVN